MYTVAYSEDIRYPLPQPISVKNEATEMSSLILQPSPPRSPMGAHRVALP
jgi:hypothetical protein